MRFYVFILICIFSLQLSAVPAYPGKTIVVVSNGKSVTITMKGDEHFKYALSEDGYTLINDDNVWKYAEKDNSGNIVSSRFALTALEDASDELKRFKEDCPKHLTINVGSSGYTARRQAKRIGIHTGDPIVGQRHALVVLMQYKDVKFNKSHEEFEALFNEEGFALDNAKGSVKDFYNFASSGQLDYVSDVYGPFTALNNLRYYGQNSSRGGGDMNPIELCMEAIRNLPKDLDYSKYDNDHDGIVDNIHIIFAGYGEEAGASSDAIWSHEYPYKIIMKNEVGVNFAGYSCTPELRGNSGKKISNIGVICHELGHALGANDYYDTNYAVEGSYEGTGQWDIMASGSWNDDGRLPPNFNPYVRTHDFGWESQVELFQDEDVILPPHSQDPTENRVLRINTATEGDYFLLENRQHIGFDISLPGRGLMIYHVHPNIDNLSATNSINDTNPQGFYPVCASGSKPSTKQYGNINSAECPFPGSKQVSIFSPTTSPAAKAWNGGYADVAISGIKLLQDGSIAFNVSQDGTTTEEPDLEEDGVLENIFIDSFETGLKGYYSSIVMGKKEWSCYPNNKIVSNTEMIPPASDGKKLIMLFTGKTQAICEAEISKKGISVNPDQKYYLSFDVIGSTLPTGLEPIFRFFIKDNNMQIYNQTLTDINGEEWKHIEVPFVSSCDAVEFGFYGNINSGGVFVDNIKIQTVKTITSVDSYTKSNDFKLSIKGHTLNALSYSYDIVEVYSLDGSLVHTLTVLPNVPNSTQLPSGVYFIKNRNGSLGKYIVK